MRFYTLDFISKTHIIISNNLQHETSVYACKLITSTRTIESSNRIY